MNNYKLNKVVYAKRPSSPTIQLSTQLAITSPNQCNSGEKKHTNLITVTKKEKRKKKKAKTTCYVLTLYILRKLRGQNE